MSDANRSIIRRAAPAAGLLLLVASLVVGADLFGTRTALFGSATPAPRASAFSRIDSAPAKAPKTVLRSQPWWQEVGRYRGTGTSKEGLFRIAAGAIQWRVTWSCRKGRFVVRTPGTPRPLVDEPCRGKRKSKEVSRPPSGGLQIDADGRWRARVEQQVDVPLIEPPTPAMRAPRTRTVATGSFYRMDQVGRGRVTIYRLAGGGYALRLSKFYVTPNIDLEITFSSLRRPKTTRQYMSRPAIFVAPLDVTTGEMNFVVPAGVDPRRFRSVVIWCPLIDSAYAAATLNHRRPAAGRRL